VRPKSFTGTNIFILAAELSHWPFACVEGQVGFAFDTYILDIERSELRHGTDRIRLEPQAFDLLTYLLRHRDRVVSRDELIQAIWGGRVVTDAALSTRINVVRRAIGDDGKTQRLIRTLSRKGIRFIGEVTETFEQNRCISAGRTRFLGIDRSDAPSITVLPFAAITDDRDSEIVAAGVAEEIATVLIRIPRLLVVAQDSWSSHTSHASDMRSVGQELGIRYIVVGSVRRNRDRLRIAVQLIDAGTRAYLWAERFEGELRDAFQLQDTAATTLASAIEPKLAAMEARHVPRGPLSDLTIGDLYLQGLQACYAYNAVSLLRAPELLDHAVERDPDNAPALLTGLALPV
jgi:TolB-like protein